MRYLNRYFSLIIISFAALLTGCHKDQEPNKILYTQPVNTTITVIPAYAAQEFMLLKRDIGQTLVPIVNRIGLTNQVYPELTGPDGSSQYTFQRSESHYGTVTFTIQFRDELNAVIDPITTQTSSTTLKSVIITGTGSSSRFTYTENLILTLDDVNTLDTKKRITGTANFTGSTYNLNFTIVAPGITTSFDGLSAGTFQVSGTGGPSSSAASIQLSLASNQNANGSISWEGETGGLHLANDGSGFVSTSQYLVPIQ